ncbi:sel1 repeat family protein [Clostridium sp. SHJSY1]|uniref:tetratricopeptide repeat protein n=1 Tax=Clostridium sp. SHJSY1 TaxID=2942483 RepID=UPI0028760463|nr:tetratricopeptide repeat protein [Clostridium sp. SHJSY1]MDS0525902.1 sel1 repeat family protein [Clostridium sp. SHJSY1]
MENVIDLIRRKDLKYDAKKVNADNVEIQYMYAKMYFNGDGVEVNYEEGIKWLNIAAENGHGEAQCHLGACYYNGEKLERDYNKAVELFTMAKENKNPLAYVCLGLAYLEGNGVKKKNRKKAYEYFKKAHKLAEPIGTYRLANCYYIGIGVEKNLLKALNYYEKAIKNGYTDDIKIFLLCLKESVDKFESFKNEIKDGDGAEFRDFFELNKKITVFSDFVELLK